MRQMVPEMPSQLTISSALGDALQLEITSPIIAIAARRLMGLLQLWLLAS